MHFKFFNKESSFMTNKYLQIAFFSTLLGSWGLSIADEVHPPCFKVYVPNPCTANEFTVGALFLRPGGSNDYAVLVSPFNPNVATPILSPGWEPKGISPSFNANFLLNFRHIFSNSGTDLTLSWIHMRTSDNASFPVDRNPPPAQQMTGPFWNIGPDAGTTSSANGQVKYHYDVINGEIGKTINFDPDLQIRLFTGLSGLWIQQKLNADFSGTDPILDFYTFGIATKSKFSAAGVRLGFNTEYQWWQKIKFISSFAGNIFVGSQQPYTSTTGTGTVLTDAGIPVNHQFISHESYTQLVPALDGKLALKFSSNCYHKTFSIEGGYMASVYVNAIQNYVPSTYVPDSLGIVTGSVFLQSLLKTTDSFSVDGPYVTFSLTL